MNAVHATLIAILQGATELFPVSSLGHAVVLPSLVNWAVDQRSPEFLPFLVLLHLGTALALLAYFWRDWLALVLGVLGVSGAERTRESRRVFMLIIIATIPAVVIGFVLEKFVRGLFGSPVVAASFLIVNGVMLLATERLRTRAVHARPMATLGVADAVVIGFWQCLALIPGISRSGATIVGGLLRGVDHAGSAHFSFLIATPIILGATVLEVPHLLHEEVAPGVFQTAALAAVVAGVVAWLSTAFLMRWFRQHEQTGLNPFGIYCIVFGAAALGVILT